MLQANLEDGVPVCPKCNTCANGQTRIVGYDRYKSGWYFTYKCQCKKMVQYYANTNLKCVEEVNL